MYYFGVHYCARKYCYTWKDWAFWYCGHTTETYLPDIERRRFLRLLGIEFKLMWWKPEPFRADLPADPHTIYGDRHGSGWQLVKVSPDASRHAKSTGTGA